MCNITKLNKKKKKKKKKSKKFLFDINDGEYKGIKKVDFKNVEKSVLRRWEGGG